MRQLRFSPISFRGRPISAGPVLCLTVLLLSAFCLLPSARCQTPESIETLRIDTDLVNLSVSVFGRDVLQPAPSLRQEEFAVFENGEPQRISFFAASETPFDLVLLLDLSGSTSDKIGLIRKSSKRFVDAARPGDRIAILTFTADIQLVSGLTLDHVALKKDIDDIEKQGGGTNFWDALRFVLEHVLGQSRAERRRSAVIVMTDGIDNALPGIRGDGSVTTFEELLGIVRRSDTIVFPIFLDTEKEMLKSGQASPQNYVDAKRQLTELAAESGNTVYQARKIKDLEGVYTEVIRDLGTVYSIGYRPADRPRDGSWRSVSVQLIGHPELAVRSKRGYYSK